MTAQPAPAPAPLPPAVQEILHGTPIGPLLNQPVDKVLASLGIPALPQFPPLPPLPGLPPLPQLDPATLLKPITDMFGHLGTGNLGSMGALDPTQVLPDVANGLTQVISLGSTALSLLTSLEGSGTQAAATKSSEAQGNSAAVADQATGMSTLVGAAATVVQIGNAELAAIAVKLAAELAVSAGAPGGAPFAAAAAAEASAEAAAVIAQVKAELGVLAVQMTAVGQPVPITSMPNPAQSASSSAKTTAKTATSTTTKAAAKTANATKAAATTAKSAAATTNSATNAATTAGTGAAQGADALQGAVQPVSQLAQAAGISPDTAALSAMPMAFPAETLSSSGGFGDGLGSAVAMSEVGGPVVGEPLQATVLEAPVEQSLGDVTAHTGSVSMASAESAPMVAADAAARAGAGAGAPMMPMGGGGMLGRAGLVDGEEIHGSGVHGQHGDEVVGDLDGLVMPVVGATAQPSGPGDDALTI